MMSTLQIDVTWPELNPVMVESAAVYQVLSQTFPPMYSWTVTPPEGYDTSEDTPAYLDITVESGGMSSQARFQYHPARWHLWGTMLINQLADTGSLLAD